MGNKRAKTTARQHNVRPRRVRKGQKGRLLPVILLVVAAIVSIGTLNKIRLAYADYRLLQVQVDDKEVQLAALRKQYEAGQRRLAVLTSKKGRDQLLIKHGYVPPGDRILLFPPDPEKPNAAAISGNDLSPRPPADENAHVPLWRRAGETFGGWWQGLNRAAGGATQPGPPPQPDAEHDQPAPDLASPGP